MDKLHHGQLSSTSIIQPTEDLKDNMQCPICQEKAEKKCSACKTVAYCCVEHQKLDWKNHKKVCQAFSIEKTDDLGMGWIATRGLKAGVLLLEEAPVIQAPGWNLGPPYSDQAIIKCLSCGLRISMVSDSICSSCFWPVCSEKCEKDPLHMKNECKEFISRKLKYSLSSGWPVGMITMCMRATVMKTRDPKKFKQLMALQDFYSDLSSNQELQQYDLPPGMFEVLSGPNGLNREEFRKLLRICKVHCFKQAADSSEFLYKGAKYPDTNFCIYLNATLINHSCFPNCEVTFGPAPARKTNIFTSVPVTKGTPLTHNYFEAFSALPTEIRQQILISSTGFTCKCKRCLDPTELGSFLSGIKCFSCSSEKRNKSLIRMGI